MRNRSDAGKGKGKAVAASATKAKGSKRPRGESSKPRKSVEKPPNLHVSLDICKVHPTKFIDWEAMTQLGVSRDMDAIFTEMGIRDYMHRSELTHPDETIEFMRTVAPHGGPTDPSFADEGISFRIRGKSYRLSHDDIRGIYGFRIMQMRWEDEGSLGGLSDLWDRAAVGPFRLGKSKSSTIRNPTIKLLQRCLGFSFFGRHEVGQVILSEWRMIGSALRPVAHQLTPQPRHIPSVDPTVLFVSNIFRSQEIAAKVKPQDWPLCIGGTLTPIFRHIGIELSTPVRPVPMIDIQHLYACRFLNPERRNAYHYTFTWAGVQMTLPLPVRDPDMIRCTTPGNIAFELTPAQLRDDSIVIYQPAPAHASSSTARPSARYDEPMAHPPLTPFEQETTRQIGLLKRWNRWQDRCIRKMAAHIAKMKRKCTCHGDTTGIATSAIQDRSPTPESSNPSLELSPPPSDRDSPPPAFDA